MIADSIPSRVHISLFKLHACSPRRIDRQASHSCHRIPGKMDRKSSLATSFCHNMTKTSTSSDPTQSTANNDEQQVPIPPILRLPPELFDHLLHHVNPEDLQSTALALSRVFPDHPISRTHLWRHVVARSKDQMIPMWKKMREMRGSARGGPEATRTFSMVRLLLFGRDIGFANRQETWKGDADILNK